MSAINWPTVSVDAIDMRRAAAQLVDELGHERSDELIAALADVAHPNELASIDTQCHGCKEWTFATTDVREVIQELRRVT